MTPEDSQLATQLILDRIQKIETKVDKVIDAQHQAELRHEKQRANMLKWGALGAMIPVGLTETPMFQTIKEWLK